MRIPTRSEEEAFKQTIAAAALLGLAAVIGALTEPLIGVAVFVVGVVVAAIAYLRAPNPDRREPLRDAARAEHPHGAPAGRRQVLVIANEALAGTELRERIVGKNGRQVQVDVLAPVLSSRVHLTVTDIDHEIAQARERLDRSLAWARENGLAARGEVGDASPIDSIADQLRDFGADEVIVVTHARDAESWQERGELERLRQELDVPVTHIAVAG